MTTGQRRFVWRRDRPVPIEHQNQSIPDEVIPLHLGPGLFAAAREPKSFRLVPGAGHNDIAETAGASYRQYLHSLYGRLRNSAH